MATVHVGANADPHPSIILVPPEGWPVPTGRPSCIFYEPAFSPIVPDDHAWRSALPSAVLLVLKKERPRFSPEKRPSAATVPMLMGYGAAVK